MKLMFAAYWRQMTIQQRPSSQEADLQAFSSRLKVAACPNQVVIREPPQQGRGGREQPELPREWGEKQSLDVEGWRRPRGLLSGEEGSRTRAEN